MIHISAKAKDVNLKTKNCERSVWHTLAAFTQWRHTFRSTGEVELYFHWKLCQCHHTVLSWLASCNTITIPPETCAKIIVIDIHLDGDLASSAEALPSFLSLGGEGERLDAALPADLLRVRLRFFRDDGDLLRFLRSLQCKTCHTWVKMHSCWRDIISSRKRLHLPTSAVRSFSQSGSGPRATSLPEQQKNHQ